MSELERAKQAFAEMAADYVVKAAEAKVASGEAEWMLDPEVRDVSGLILKGTNRALVVVYMNGTHPDFECDDELIGNY